MHKKAYELIWLHFFRFLIFLPGPFFGPPLETMKKICPNERKILKIINQAYAKNFRHLSHWKVKIPTQLHYTT